MTGSIGWGILGTGGIARKQTSDLASNGFRIAAVGSRSQKSADDFAVEFDIPTAHGSYEALVADSSVDVIYVATPHPFHAENALLALRAGKHVLIEKSFTVNSAEARSVVDAADAAGLVVMEAMWTRFLPHMVRIREIIAAGTIGDVRTVQADHNQNLPADPAHRVNNPVLGGGALLDLGIYPVSFAFDILGVPTSITATAGLSSTGVDRQTAIVFGFNGGRQALVQCALDTAGPNTAAIIGTDGYIVIDKTWYAPTSFTVYNSDDEVLERYESAVEPRGMQFQAEEIERRITEGQSSGDILPPAESVAIMESLDEVRRQIGVRYPFERESVAK